MQGCTFRETELDSLISPTQYSVSRLLPCMLQLTDLVPRPGDGARSGSGNENRRSCAIAIIYTYQDREQLAIATL